ncbi:MAG: hypothetical protein A2X94_11685 [Bdellovibrionales bacterium GWB1_55_8]|nr:MAG: hypothetical protein A2X94_11685 [Bdellovibrionales bacterium GWB1_55_8]
MKTKNFTRAALALALATTQLALQIPTALADDDIKNPARCDLSIRPERELVNTQVVARIKGRWDYTGRNYWNDMGVIGVGIVGSALIFPGIFCVVTFYDHTSEGCGAWGRRTRENRTRNSADWYEDAKDDLRAKCNKFLKKKYKEDIIDADGFAVTAEHYACTEPREQRTSKGIKLIIDIVRGDPVYKNLNFDEIQAKRCNKLLGCSARAKTDEALDWIARKQMELGCS